MQLRKTLRQVHTAFEKAKIDHALIGGMAMASYGSMRVTDDLDFLIHEDERKRAENVLTALGFVLLHRSREVLQLKSDTHVDLLLARRPISQNLLAKSLENGPEGVRFVSAEGLIGLKIQAYSNDPSRKLKDLSDVEFLIKNEAQLDWDEIKSYADLFEKWSDIFEIKKNCGL